MRYFWTGILLAFALLAGRMAHAQAATGTLNFDVKPFTSEVPLKKKIQSRLESGGIEWGAQDGRIVITLVNKRFIDFDISHMTRFGRSESLMLPAGDYSITTIGLEMHTAFSPEKVLAKGAYVNENIVSFHIEPGKTTTLSILPIMKKDMTFMIDWYMPALSASVTTDTGTSAATILNIRGPNSIAWPNYSGPLKFVGH